MASGGEATWDSESAEAPVNRYALTRAEVLGVVIATAIIVVLVRFAGLPIQAGDDFLWYRNGVDRVVAGLPPYDPRLLAGSYAFNAPENFYVFNMAPWLIPIVAPFTLLPPDAGRWAWLVAMDVCTAAAIVLVLPERHRLLIAILLILSTPVLMSLVWGNLTGLVMLGVALWLRGRERGRDGVMALGLILASLKLLPAVPLALAMLREGRWRAVLASGAIVGAAVGVLMLITGRNLLVDFAQIISNIRLDERTSIAPAAFLGPASLLPIRIACGLAILVIALRSSSLLAVATMELLVCGLVTNLYVDWLLAPAFVFIFALRARDRGQAAWSTRPGASRETVARGEVA